MILPDKNIKVVSSKTRHDLPWSSANAANLRKTEIPPPPTGVPSYQVEIHFNTWILGCKCHWRCSECLQRIQHFAAEWATRILGISSTSQFSFFGAHFGEKKVKYLDFPNTTNGWHQSRQCPLAAAAQASQNSLNCRNPIISCQLDHYFCSNNILHRLHSNSGEWNMKCDQFLFVLCCEWLVSFLVEIFATFVRAAGGDTSWFARPPLTILLRCTSWPELETGDITHLPNTEGAYDISR